MYKIIACWSAPKPEDVDAFEKHYAEVHLPAAAACANLRRLVAIRTADNLDGAEPSFYRVAELHFDSEADLLASQQTPAFAAMRADAGEMIGRFGVSLDVGIGTEVDAELNPA